MCNSQFLGRLPHFQEFFGWKTADLLFENRSHFLHKKNVKNILAFFVVEEFGQIWIWASPVTIVKIYSYNNSLIWSLIITKIWLFSFVVTCGDALQSEEKKHGVVTYFLFVFFVLDETLFNLHKPLIWTIIWQTVSYNVKSSNRGNIYNITINDASLAVHRTLSQHIFSTFCFGLAFIFKAFFILYDDHLWSYLCWSFSDHSLMIISDLFLIIFLMIIFDHLYEPHC